MSAPRVLVVDDEVDMRWVLRGLFRDAGYLVDEAADGAAALAVLGDHPPDVVLSDVRMAGMDGLALLTRIHQLDRELPVVLLSAVEQVDTAVQAIKHGAFDWLSKPFDADRLLRTVGRAAEQRRLQREVADLRERVDGAPTFGTSAAAVALSRTIDLVAPQVQLGVLLTGESGTGKEVVARAIHRRSPRAAGPFVAIDCGALPEALMESQLFGHRRGAFTGADQDRAGLFRAADGGTLFLDELGNLPLALQSKLLRALQERVVVPVGGGEPVRFDARLVTATNADLDAAVRDGTFRMDLYHRIAEFTVRIPALRERRADIVPFARRFLTEAAAEMARPVTGFTPQAERTLTDAAWPGNLRELRNAVRRAVVLCAGTEIDAIDLVGLERAPIPSDDVRVALAADADHDGDGDGDAAGRSLGERIRRASEVLEAEILTRTLASHGGNKAATARALRIDYTTLHRKLKRYGIGRDGDGDT